MARHTKTGKFIPGRDLAAYRGAASHDPSTEEIKTSLHVDKNPARKVVVPHDNQLAPGVDNGRKPLAHDCADGGCNKAANAAFNDAAQNPPNETTNAGRLVGAGIKLS